MIVNDESEDVNIYYYSLGQTQEVWQGFKLGTSQWGLEVLPTAVLVDTDQCKNDIKLNILSDIAVKLMHLNEKRCFRVCKCE
jgi:hypothetical protein